jgi:hypothetical protein
MGVLRNEFEHGKRVVVSVDFDPEGPGNANGCVAL